MSSENHSLGQIQTQNIRNSNEKIHDGNYGSYSPQYSDSIGKTSFRKHGSGRPSNFTSDSVSSSLSSLNSPKYSNPNIFYNSFKNSDPMLSPFDHKDYTTNSTTKKSFMDTVFNRKKLSKSDVFKFHENERDDDDDYELFYLNGYSNEIKVSICIKSLWENIKIPLKFKVSEAIDRIIQNKDIPGTAQDYNLYKLDRNIPGNKILLNPDEMIHNLINNGDELKLKLQNEIENVTVNIPSLKIQVSLKYNQELSIKDAIKTLQSNLKSEERYGLYNKNLGFWLDDNKLLSSYDLTDDTILELRALAEEFFIRILDVENDLKFALRALPGFSVSDILAMINNTIINRKIKHNSKNGIYGLKRKGRWMEENKTLDQFNEMKFTLHEQQECLEYQIQYEMIKVQTGDYTVHNIFVDQSTTIGDLIELMGLIDAQSEENVYQIVSPSGEHFNNDENIWKLLSEDAILENDKLLFKQAPKPITLSAPTIGKDIRLEFLLDFSEPLSVLIPYICRRFGIRFMDLDYLRMEDGIELKKELSLEEQRVKAGSRLILEIKESWSFEKPQTPVPQTPIDNNPNINIWDELSTPEQIQYTKDNLNIASATLNKLVEKLTEEKNGNIDYLSFVKTFLLTYPSFTTPAILLQKLRERYHVPLKKFKDFNEFDKMRLFIQIRVCSVLEKWTKNYNYELVNTKDGEEIKQLLLNFVEGIIAKDQWKLAKTIRKTIYRMKKKENKICEQINLSINNVPIIKGVFNYNFTNEEIAQQLTLLDFEIFQKIGPCEFLNQAWNKPDGHIKAPNILHLTSRFNSIAFWVARCILEGNDAKQRAVIMTRFIEIAQHLLQLNNYSTTMAFIAGFNKSSILRLKLTFKELSQRASKKLSLYEKLLTAEKSYHEYRESLHSSTQPCIPYIGVYLTDLTYMEDGNPNFIDNRINFTKRSLISTLIREIQQYQSIGYTLKPIKELQQLLEFPLFSEEMEKRLYDISLVREPRAQQQS
jgi:hypothetical protein